MFMFSTLIFVIKPVKSSQSLPDSTAVSSESHRCELIQGNCYGTERSGEVLVQAQSINPDSWKTGMLSKCHRLAQLRFETFTIAV